MTGPSALRTPADRHKVPVKPGSPPLAERSATAQGEHQTYRAARGKVRPMQLGHRTTRCSPGRTENAVFAGLMGAFLAGSPFVAYAAGRWANAALARQARLQRNARFPVPATLLRAAPLRTGSGTRSVRPVLAQWRAAGGHPPPAPGPASR